MIGEAGFGGLKSICPPAGHGAPSSMNAVSSVFMGMTPKIHGDRVQRGVKLCGPAMLRLFCALTLLIPAVAASAAAQDPQPPVAQLSPPVLRITVLMIQVDAVVTDSAGKHVAGLRPEDFEILQDGVAQKLTYFSYEPGAPPLPLSEAAPDPNSKPAAKVPVGPPAPSTAGQVRRTVALVVDDLALGFEDLVRVREALRQYVERQMQPGDLVALVRTGGGVAILEQFTTDRRVLLEAIDLLKWRF